MNCPAPLKPKAGLGVREAGEIAISCAAAAAADPSFPFHPFEVGQQLPVPLGLRRALHPLESSTPVHLEREGCSHPFGARSYYIPGSPTCARSRPPLLDFLASLLLHTLVQPLQVAHNGQLTTPFDSAGSDFLFLRRLPTHPFFSCPSFQLHFTVDAPLK